MGELAQNPSRCFFSRVMGIAALGLSRALQAVRQHRFSTLISPLLRLHK
jgi:hypothetical protein